MPVPITLAWKQRIFDALHRLGFELEKTQGRWPYTLRRRETFGEQPLSDIRTILGADPRGIIDVGAHIGQSAIAFRRAFPDATIASIEPDPENFRALLANTRHDPGIRAINAAAGRSAGSARLHRNVGSQTHSLLPVAAGAQAFVVAPEILQTAGDVEVDVVTVDQVSSTAPTWPDLLKVDAQGYELEVLAGATDTLRRRPAPLLLLEVLFVPHYDRQAMFDEVYRWVFDRGYRLVNLYDAGFRTHYYLVGANALFVHESMGARQR